MRGGINLRTVAVTGHRISLHDGAIHAVLDDLAVESVGPVGEMAVALADE
jgi:hypothetical protein